MLKRKRKKGRILLLFVIGILFVAGVAFGNQGAGSDSIAALDDSSESNNSNGQDALQAAAKQKAAKRAAAREAERLAEESQNEAKEAVKPDIDTVANRSIKDVSSATKWKIDVSISEQKVRIYSDDELIKEWMASTGESNCTPLGSFTIKQKGEWFFSEKYKQGGKWWVAFKGNNYLFHSVPMDRRQNIIPEEAEKLGSAVSHGCIRLRVEDAKWLYDNIPGGTPVLIHN
jgi:lipoprotein-anchoring transpeptidase ErfK/SrfK